MYDDDDWNWDDPLGEQKFIDQVRTLSLLLALTLLLMILLHQLFKVLI